MNTDTLLTSHYDAIDKIILRRQDPITGLLPASTAVNAHGDYTDAWVRDNVYSILCVWGLGMAYEKHDPSHPNGYTLSHSVVKLMRGLLGAMMRQSDRVERFKKSRNPVDALHAKYGTSSGLAVVGDSEWGHLQLDATSIFLLMLAQMSASGLRIIYNADEVNFVQNLVHYISHAYSTPDYGIWERGNKINHGDVEINCSSVGMAKAALEAMDGFNLYGSAVSGREGVIHVVSSDIARARFTLQGLLPRESTSKETDAALLSIVGYPAYAVEDADLVERTRGKVIKKLAGGYGCKRFLLDGHQSELEDTSRLHYEPEELRQFEHIESEWPLFFTYLLLDALMRGDEADAAQWREKLQPLFVESDGKKLLPELYIVPKASIDAEKASPGSQPRRPNENIPLVWAQSLYMLSALMDDGLLAPDDIDPLGRRARIGQIRQTQPQVGIIAENTKVQARLASMGVPSETVQALPVSLLHATQLSMLYTRIGVNEKLSLSGRPYQVSRTIFTSRPYRIDGKAHIFLPYHFNPRAYYIHFDNELLDYHIRASLRFLTRHWTQPGEPLFVILVREDMLPPSDQNRVTVLLKAIASGRVDNINITVGPLGTLMEAAVFDQIDNAQGYMPTPMSLLPREQCHTVERRADLITQLDAQQRLAMEQDDDSTLQRYLLEEDKHAAAVEALELLWGRHGEAYCVATPQGELSLIEIAERQYERLSACHDWAAVRRLADLLHRYDERLEDVLLDIVIRQKRLAVGRAYFDKATFMKPVESSRIVNTIYAYCGNSAAESVLTQEIILHLGHLIRNEPHLFEQLLTLRTWYFVQLLVSRIGREKDLSLGDAYEALLALPPHDILRRLREALGDHTAQRRQMIACENLRASGTDALVSVSRITDLSEVTSWMHWRQEAGLIGHYSNHFYKDIWYMLRKCGGIVIGDKYNIANRIGSEQTLDTTAGERSFELRIDALLQTIQSPEYRQLNIEAIESLAWLFKQNDELEVNDDIILDVLVGHAVRIAWGKDNDDAHYNEQRSQAWEAFYRDPPAETETAFIKAFRYLLSEGFSQ